MTKDDIDAASMILSVSGDHAFQIYLTRGGLTQRRGSSDRVDPTALMIKGSTDCFEPFMAAVPQALLDQGGGVLEDGGAGGTRHDWRFEFGGGMESLIYDVSYDAHSTSLPDEFADMVVLAERLTHSWYLAAVAEEMGAPPAAKSVVAAPTAKTSPASPRKGVPPAKKAAQASKAAPGRPTARGPARGKPGQLVPATRERIALAVLVDLFALSIPYSFVSWLFVGGGERAGPPGAGLVLFAIVEFVILQIARRSPGLWLLGMSMPQEGRPLADPTWHARESKATLAVGIGLCGLGAAGLTSWTLYHTAVPYFGFAFPLWLSVPVSVIGSLGLVLAGALLLRTDARGVWLAGGLAVLLLIFGVTGWSSWGAFVDTAVSNLSAYKGRPVGQGFLGPVLDLVPVLLVIVPAVLGFGVYESWKRLTRAGVPMVGAAATRS